MFNTVHIILTETITTNSFMLQDLSKQMLCVIKNGKYGANIKKQNGAPDLNLMQNKNNEKFQSTILVETKNIIYKELYILQIFDKNC